MTCRHGHEPACTGDVCLGCMAGTCEHGSLKCGICLGRAIGGEVRDDSMREQAERLAYVSQRKDHRIGRSMSRVRMLRRVRK